MTVKHKTKKGSLDNQQQLLVEYRKELVECIEKQLKEGMYTLPNPEDNKKQGKSEIYPLDEIFIGVLYPVFVDEGLDPAVNNTDIDDSSKNSDLEEDNSEDTYSAKVRYIPPSSVGFSFYVENPQESIDIYCYGEGRQYQEKQKYWELLFLNEEVGDHELPLDTVRDEGGLVFSINKPSNNQYIVKLWQDRASLSVIWRPHATGFIVTVSLSNVQSMRDVEKHHLIELNQRSIFNVGLKARVSTKEIQLYPRVEYSLLDDEEQEIELQYRHKHIYALGHGAAVDWHDDKKNNIIEISTQWMPKIEVPQMTADTISGGVQAFDLKFLSQLLDKHNDVLTVLEAFVQNYNQWIEEQQNISISEKQQPVAQRMILRMKEAKLRMQEGLKLLKKDKKVAKSFAMANEAMLWQMQQGDKVQGKTRPAYRWRPFQLGFILLSLSSIVNQDDHFRDTVDLIWFPTGGGKTEAYLAVMSFLIIYRRLHYPSTAGGTNILMRYTLRLLAQDQFLRACRLICALELMRQKYKELGNQAITIGMWVGGSTSPNTCEEAYEKLRKARERSGNRADKENQQSPKIVIEHCPWCGQLLDLYEGYYATSEDFHFHCTNKDCEFINYKRLPCNVVDEVLYQRPPTLLVATIDKMARLTWDERASVFFGSGVYRPPELIIQDELHLISSALGSIAGLYEAGIESVIQMRGVYPKYIASTATIRMAKSQIHKIYGKKHTVFPPPGLSCDDSYFAKTVSTKERPGRMYVGYMVPRLNRKASLAPLSALLLDIPVRLANENNIDKDILLDAWWTSIFYHGSLQGIANSHTILSTETKRFLSFLYADAGRDQNPKSEPKQLKPDSNLPRYPDHIIELTSHNPDSVHGFKLLREDIFSGKVVDVALATNMISVGLDVERLALMVINGQPLTTAEYIQASSRVGRGHVPGIVFVNYYRDQARSLSHYESFRPYHDSFYRYVEPSSVTPFSFQARVRALHAALVIVVRHGAGLLKNEQAGDFSLDNGQIRNAIAVLKSRCAKACDDEEIIRHIDRLVDDWLAYIDLTKGRRRSLHYQVKDSDSGLDRLLYMHEARIEGLWPTLNSMRNVEKTPTLKVK